MYLSDRLTYADQGYLQNSKDRVVDERRNELCGRWWDTLTADSSSSQVSTKSLTDSTTMYADEPRYRVLFDSTLQRHEFVTLQAISNKYCLC